MSRKARARAQRFDGWFADTASPTELTTTPEELAALLEGHSFGDVAVMGYSEPGERELHDAYAAAGATWWIESMWGAINESQPVLAAEDRLREGPPR